MISNFPAVLRRPALLALPVALLVVACGNQVPPNSVAKVDDEVIKKSEFEHWLGAASKGQQAPGSAPAATPDPPTFTNCVAAKSKQEVPKGSEKPSKADLKSECRQQYDALKGQVMQFLVSASWIRLEAQ